MRQAVGPDRGLLSPPAILQTLSHEYFVETQGVEDIWLN